MTKSLLPTSAQKHANPREEVKRGRVDNPELPTLSKIEQRALLTIIKMQRGWRD